MRLHKSSHVHGPIVLHPSSFDFISFCHIGCFSSIHSFSGNSHLLIIWVRTGSGSHPWGHPRGSSWVETLGEKNETGSERWCKLYIKQSGQEFKLEPSCFEAKIISHFVIEGKIDQRLKFGHNFPLVGFLQLPMYLFFHDPLFKSLVNSHGAMEWYRNSLITSIKSPHNHPMLITSVCNGALSIFKHILLMCFPISQCHPVFRTSANSPFLFWGYCLDLLSQADKGIHLAANPFSDLDQVSEAHQFTSKYLCRLISEILPA